MKRFPDWERRLDAHCRQRMRMPFEWGRQDCALFVADAVLAMTGMDIAAECRGRYVSEAAAGALLAGLTGGGGLEQYVAQVALRQGLGEVGVKFAQRGDMILRSQSNIGHGPTLGIVSLDGQRGLFAGLQGLERFPVLDSVRAWRVA